MAELDGRIALVTGASSGIGASTARALARAGAMVVATDLSPPEDLADEIGGRAFALDVTSEAAWMEAMAFVQKRTGGLDILVNNAGLFLLKPIAEISLAEWRRVHAVNVEGVFLGSKHAIPLLAQRASQWVGGASIVNLSSGAGLRGAAFASCYNASKGAVRLFTKGLALEVAPLHIRVNSVHPGLIDTAMGEDVVESYVRTTGALAADILSQFTENSPLGRIGQPGEVADAITFLASDKAAFMTGSELVIDGGATAK